MKKIFMLSLVVVIGLIGCSSSQEKPSEKIDFNKPPKCKSEIARKAMTIYSNTSKDVRGLSMKRMLELEKKGGYKHDVDIEEDLGVLAGTRTRVCKIHSITKTNGKIDYYQRPPKFFMYYYGDDNKLIVKKWKKGQEN